MKIAWFGLYVLASIWIVGMVISATGLPFGPLGLASAPKAMVAGPAVVAPSAPVAAAPAKPDPAVAAGHEGIDQVAMTAAPVPTRVPSVAEHPSHATIAATETRGSQLRQPRMEGDVKVFDLEAAPIKWEVLPGTFVDAWAYNGQVPGPLLRVTEGDKMRVNLTNRLPEPTVIHFHGPNLPNIQDGVPGVTQEVVQPGESYTYEFTADPAGSFVYHTHHNAAVQEPKGLYGMFIVDPQQGGGLTYNGDARETRPARYDREYLQITSELGGYFVINGKAFPSTEPMTAKLGERALIRLANLGQASHPMHLHGQPFNIVGTDGYPVQGAPLTKDTINVAPGERYDLEILAKNPGAWLFHCHILSHVTNQGVEPGGMISVFTVE
jgi:FtsP/CotA-like multicopper oxidase with cupredoxin domain